jgi:hypothetical protein
VEAERGWVRLEVEDPALLRTVICVKQKQKVGIDGIDSVKRGGG